MKNIIKIICVIIGTIVGAGFASGQEVYTFFFSFGIKGVLGIVISSIIIGITINKTFNIINKNRINTYDEFLKYLIKNEKIEKFLNMLINIFILISFYIMIAGFGAYLNQEYHINSMIGSCILAIICFIIFKTNLSGLIKVNQILIPILFVILIIVRIFKYREHTC